MTAGARRSRGAGVLVAASLLAACAGLGGVRPLFEPVPGSLTLELEGAPDAAVRAAAEEIQHAGPRVRALSPEEGYLETDWFDLRTRESSSESPFRDIEQWVKVRVFADPVAGRTRLVAECVTVIAWDRSRPPRELERMAPEGHPGRALLDAFLERMRRRLTAAR